MSSRRQTLVLSLLFALTGIGTALLGATLPAILGEWRLSDSRGGLLLLAAWGGATTGAVFVRRRPERTNALGLALSAAGLLALSRPRPSAVLALYLLFGLGLGLTMTSISVLRSRGLSFASADLELNRLNLLWAAGAVTTPALAAHSLRLLSVTSLFRALGALFAAGAATALLFTSNTAPDTVPDRNTPAASAAPPAPPASLLRWAPLRFGLFAAAAVGLESAIGSWLTTYAERSLHGVTTAVSANAAFWAGLLISRAAHSVPAATLVHTRLARLLHLLAVGLALALLLAVPGRHTIPAAGLLCGLGLGPLYPFVLSLALPRYRSTAIFVLAGVGASLVPWLTGVLSSALGSLRAGLIAPATTFLLLALAAFFMRSELAGDSPPS